MTEFVVETRGLTRYFGSKKIVDSLDLSIPRGSVFGFLGRNGAGKSTTIRMLLGLVEPTRGEATVLGHPSTNLPPQVRSRIGYLAEGHHVYGWMTVRESGRFQAALESEHFRWRSQALWSRSQVLRQKLVVGPTRRALSGLDAGARTGTSDSR